MLGLNLKKLTITVVTKDKNFGVSIPFESGLNVIRAENSSGKSTFINAIAYALGLDAILGPSRHSPFPNAMIYAICTDKPNKNEQGALVIDSFVDLELCNRNGDFASLRRHIKGNTEKITVTDKLGVSNDYFLKSAGSVGSAISERGFHYWLERFIGWSMPQVPKFDGGLTHLYLECIFPLFFIEQKRGWSEIQANTPLYYKIRNLKRTALEYCLGVTDFSNRGDIENYKAKLKSLESEWEAATASLSTLAELNNLIVTFNCKIDSDDYLNLGSLYYVHSGDRYSLVEYLTSLRRRIKQIDQGLQGWSFGEELNNALSQRQSITAKIFTLSEKINGIEGSEKKINKKLTSLEKDIDRYKQLRRLIKVGAEHGLHIETENCPICDTRLQETFLPSEENYAPLTIEQNIVYLEDQRKFYEGIKQRVDIELKTHSKEIFAMQGELSKIDSEIKSHKDEERKYLAAFGSEIEEVTELRFIVREFEKVAQQRDKLNEQAKAIFAQHAITRKSLDIAKNANVGGVSTAIVKALKEKLIANLEGFDYKNNNINWLEISDQTFRPELDGFDIVADTSASDFIRIIWGYTLALMELGIDFQDVKHGGFVVFDEPRQHEASQSSFISLLKKSKEKFANMGQVIIATSIPSESIVDLEIDNDHLNIFEDGEYIIKPLS